MAGRNGKMSTASTYLLAIADWLRHETEFLEGFAFVDQLTDVPED